MKPSHLPLLVLVAAFAGCEPTPTLGPRAPHGGTILPIPDRRGSVEFVKKDVEGQAEQVRFVVYFYGPDDKPMAPTPTAATLKLAGRGVQPVELKPTGDADPSLSSPSLPATGEVDGELSITIDGKPITFPIKVR